MSEDRRTICPLGMVARTLGKTFWKRTCHLGLKDEQLVNNEGGGDTPYPGSGRSIENFRREYRTLNRIYTFQDDLRIGFKRKS